MRGTRVIIHHITHLAVNIGPSTPGQYLPVRPYIVRSTLSAADFTWQTYPGPSQVRDDCQRVLLQPLHTHAHAHTGFKHTTSALFTQSVPRVVDDTGHALLPSHATITSPPSSFQLEFSSALCRSGYPFVTRGRTSASHHAVFQFSGVALAISCRSRPRSGISRRGVFSTAKGEGVHDLPAHGGSV